MASMMSVCNPGDKVVLFSPFYENYSADTILCGATPVYVPLSPVDLSFDADVLESAIASLAVKYDLYVITDEVYEHIIYAPHRHTYISTLPGMFERTIECSSLSKTYSITGWRLGYVLAAELLAAGLRVLRVLRGGDLAAEAARYPEGTCFLVECGRGALPGGNGAAWDWSAARALSPLPFALAGGLGPDNLAAAASASGAVFLDLSSSVESAPGRKDRDKVLAAVAAARAFGGDPAFLS